LVNIYTTTTSTTKTIGGLLLHLKKMEPILVIAHSIFENPPLTQFGENIVAKSSADKLTSKRFNTRIVEL